MRDCEEQDDEQHGGANGAFKRTDVFATLHFQAINIDDERWKYAVENLGEGISGLCTVETSYEQKENEHQICLLGTFKSKDKESRQLSKILNGLFNSLLKKAKKDAAIRFRIIDPNNIVYFEQYITRNKSLDTTQCWAALVSIFSDASTEKPSYPLSVDTKPYIPVNILCKFQAILQEMRRSLGYTPFVGIEIGEERTMKDYLARTYDLELSPEDSKKYLGEGEDMTVLGYYSDHKIYLCPGAIRDSAKTNFNYNLELTYTMVFLHEFAHWLFDADNKILNRKIERVAMEESLANAFCLMASSRFCDTDEHALIRNFAENHQPHIYKYGITHYDDYVDVKNWRSIKHSLYSADNPYEYHIKRWFEDCIRDGNVKQNKRHLSRLNLL